MTNFYLFNHSADRGGWDGPDVFVVAAVDEKEAVKKAAEYCGFPHEFHEGEYLTVKMLDPNAPVEKDGIYSFVREEETDYSVLGREVKHEEVPAQQKKMSR